MIHSGPGFILPVKADTQVSLKKFNAEALGEPGCPVEITGALVELEIDPFGVAVAARHYIDYRNASNRPIEAVKFRIGYVHADGRARLPYTVGDDAHLLQPGEQGQCRFRGAVDPATVAVKLRVLKVKFADGGIWQSAKVGSRSAPQEQGFAPLVPETRGTESEMPGAAPAVTSTAPPAAAAIAPTNSTQPVPQIAGPQPTGAGAGIGVAQPLSTASPSGGAQQPAAAAPAGVANQLQDSVPATIPGAAHPNSAAAPTAHVPAAEPFQEPGLPPRSAPVHLTAPADPMAALDRFLGTGPKQVPPKAVTGVKPGNNAGAAAPTPSSSVAASAPVAAAQAKSGAAVGAAGGPVLKGPHDVHMPPAHLDDQTPEQASDQEPALMGPLPMPK